jgi:leucyl-tRNA synthetase
MYQRQADFITECAKLGTSEAAVETAEKKGFDTGLQVSHPLDPAIKLPVHIANFVLMDYGTGAFLAALPMTSAILILLMLMGSNFTSGVA